MNVAFLFFSIDGGTESGVEQLQQPSMSTEDIAKEEEIVTSDNVIEVAKVEAVNKDTKPPPPARGVVQLKMETIQKVLVQPLEGPANFVPSGNGAVTATAGETTVMQFLAAANEEQQQEEEQEHPTRSSIPGETKSTL